jgi:plastocyanin
MDSEMWRIVLASLVVGFSTLTADAAELRGTVSNEQGAVENAVIYAIPLGSPPAASAAEAIIDQVDKLYTPFVSALRAGTTVKFPNKDNIKHHLYSVSKAKSFERPLYTGQKAAPVVFDKQGEVTLGCNIHDWMIAHILVLDTPYTKVTDKTGQAVISDMPAGTYAVRVWHPGMKGKKKAAKTPRTVTLAAAAVEIDFKIRLRPKSRWWREKPADADKNYADDERNSTGN